METSSAISPVSPSRGIEESAMEEMRRALEAAQRLIQDLQSELVIKNQRIVELEDCISAMASKENKLLVNAADPLELSPRKMKKLPLPDNTDSVVCTKSAPNTSIREQPSLTLPQPSEDLIASPNRSLHARHAKSSIDLMTMKLDEEKQANLKTTTLGQRLAMTARQRRQVAQTNRSRSPAATAAASRSTGNLQPAPENNRLAKTMPLSELLPGKPSVDRLSSTLCVEDARFRLPSMALLIAHDNPQLGKTIRNMVLKQGSVLCMLESHNGKGSSHFLLGDIVFSGDFEALGQNSCVEQRGSGCLILSQLYLAVVDTKSLQQRPGIQDIIEIELPFPSQNCDDLEALENFWRPCRSRVDVILDPYHSNQRWFPYFEGRRKMAPQFRSRGVGYLRLGDDMSNFGTAFLSADGGQTYLDHGACNAMQKPPPLAIVSTASPLPLGRTKSIRQLVETSRSNSVNEMRDGEEGEEDIATAVPVDATALEAAFDAVSQGETVDQVLLDLSQQLDRLKEENAKWTDRQVALQSIQQTLSKQGERNGLEDIVIKTNSGCGLFSVLFLWLGDCFTRVSHISVLTAALRLVEIFAPLRALPASPTLALAWKALIAETLYLLRSGNRNVAEAASQTLLTLHRGGALPLTHIVETIDDILSGHPSNDKKKAKVASNTHKVLAWLQSVLLVERSQSTLEVPVCVLTSHQLFCLLKSVKVLLAHREEPSREAAVNTLALIISIEIIQINSSQQQESRSPSPTDSQPTSPTNSLGTKISMWKNILERANTSEDKTALWQEILEGNCTESTKAIVQEIIETAKVGGKILSALCATLFAWVEPQRSATLSVSAGVKSLKRRLSSHCKLKTVASPSAQVQLLSEQSQSQSSRRDAQQGSPQDHLVSLWYETKLLLKVCPTSQNQWEAVIQAVQGAPACFSGLMAIAKERQISVGSLVRKVLPFDENTSSADQASSAALHLERIAQEDPSVANLAKQIGYIRGTLRVKIADEADFAQVGRQLSRSAS